ncbi:MAG: hypothetical protein WCB96_09705 [Candidatus Aminicenantales bacterium]
MPETIRAFSWAGMFLCRSQLNTYDCSTRVKSQIRVYRRKHLLFYDENSFGLGIGLARWPDFLRHSLRSSRGLRYSDLSEDVVELPLYCQRGMGGLIKYCKKLEGVFGALKHARQPARRMPETLEERFGRAKSGLMLAPANT